MQAPVSDQARRSVRRIADLVAKADALLITAGAGMSVDSGLPDFRSSQGFWRAYLPLEQLGVSFEQMAQPQWFSERPDMAWAWYGHRHQLYRDATPHAGYRILREWAQAMPAGAFVVTSNVDGQFLAAGFPAERLLEQHGSIHRHQCTIPCSDRVWEAGAPDLKIDLEALRATGELPRCLECGALARPNVLMFNDAAWVDVVRREQQRRYERWLAGVRGKRVVVIECGAGTAIPTIRRVGERVAERTRTSLVRINPAATEADDAALVLRLPASQALTLIDEELPQGFGRRTVEAAPVVPPVEEPVAKPIRLNVGAVTLVDLGLGLVGPFEYYGITREDVIACLQQCAKAQHDWVPLPVVGGRSAPGYTMRAGVFHSPEYDAGATPGIAIVFIQGPDEDAVLTIGLARRASEGPFLWRLLYETANKPLAALEYPRVPWVALRPDGSAARHAAMMPVVAEIGRVIAWGYLRYLAFRDASKGKEDE